MENNNKSKYLRDKSKPRSKYDRINQPKSKYIIDKDEEKRAEKAAERAEKAAEEKNDDPKVHQQPEYRKSVVTPKIAHELMEKAEEAELGEVVEEEVTVPEKIVEPEELVPEEIEEDVERKGSDTDMFKGKENDRQKQSSYRKKSREDSNKEKNYRKLARTVICIFGLGALAAFLQFFTFHVPFVPKMFVVEFSTLPALIAAIAYGPLVGVLICFIKNVVYAGVIPSSLLSDLNNFMLDSVFVFIAGWMYSRSMFKGDNNVKNPKGNIKKGYRRKRILLSSTLGALVSLVPQFFITRYIAFPLLQKFYGDRGITMASILASYQNSVSGLKSFLPAAISKFIPDIHSVSGGIIMFNLPITFVRLFVVSVITALVYKYISPFLHHRKYKSKSKSKHSSHHSHHHHHHH